MTRLTSVRRGARRPCLLAIPGWLAGGGETGFPPAPAGGEGLGGQSSPRHPTARFEKRQGAAGATNPDWRGVGKPGFPPRLPAGRVWDNIALPESLFPEDH